MLQEFKNLNPDYPQSINSLQVEACLISDHDIPKGCGGINKEGYSYKELCRQPIISELFDKIENSQLRNLADQCNNRAAKTRFKMFKVNGEYCFWGLRLSPLVKCPDLQELKSKLAQEPYGLIALNSKTVTPEMIRKITYDLLRHEVGKVCGIGYEEAKLGIGNVLDCAPHEDQCGYIFMVPNWAHKWFKHDGYVSQMRALLNK